MSKKNYQYSAFSLVEISVVVLVIGILIASIYQIAEMVPEAALQSARSLSKSSRVGRIDDLALWLDATSTSAYDKEKNNNNTISIWKDSNPKAITPASLNAQSTSLYPSYILSSINNLPATRFIKTSASVGNCLNVSSGGLINSSEDFDLYLVFSPNSLDDGIIIEKNNATATNFPFSLELVSGYYKFSVKDSSNTISITATKKAKIKTPNLIRLSRTKGAQIEIAINGISTQSSDTLTTSTLNNAELAIGCRNGSTPANFINGDIGEVAFFNRNLNIKEKSDIEEYLYQKWKMIKYTGSLAASDTVSCPVASSLNADTSVTTVPFTLTPTNLSCKSGYIGSITYTCLSGSLNINSGSCTPPSNCSIPVGTYTARRSTTYDTTFPCSYSNVSVTINTAINNIAVNSSGFYYNSSNLQTIKYVCNSDGTLTLELKSGCYDLYAGCHQYHTGCCSNRMCVNGTTFVSCNGSYNNYCIGRWNI